MSFPRENSPDIEGTRDHRLPLASKPRMVDLPVHSIHPDPHQPRGDLGDLTPLMASIAMSGVVQPIIVSPMSDGSYQVIAGHRRLAACHRLELPRIPAIVRSVEERERLEMQIIENIQRADLNPVDEALALRRLMDEHGLSQRCIAKRLGKPLTEINGTLSILKLPQDLQEGVRISEHLSRSFWIEVAREPSSDRQRQIVADAIRLGPTAQTVRKLRGLPSPKDSNTTTIRVNDLTIVVRAETGPLTPSRILAALWGAVKQVRRPDWTANQTP